MLYKEINKVLGIYLLYLAAGLIIPLGVSAYYQFIEEPLFHPQPHATIYFFYTILICYAISGFFLWMGRHATGNLYRREGLAVVVFIWFLTGIIGGLPFYLSGTFEYFIDAYFETISGLTTTGASVMHPKMYHAVTGAEIPIKKTIGDFYNITYSFYGTIKPVVDPNSGEVLFSGIEAVSKGLLFWRSFMQWVGGMGIVVLFVAILPALGVGGKTLFQAEVPGPTKESITPRIKETASMLWRIYFGFSLIEVGLLRYTNPQMSLFDAVTTTFSTISTGGFCVYNTSIEHYQSAATEWVIMLFMLLGSINFSLYFQCIRGKFYRLVDLELIVYLILLGSACIFISFHLFNTPIYPIEDITGGVFSFFESIRYGCFQTISLMTSTGFTTTNYDQWPYVNQILLLLLMFIGSMSGSTGGGIKIIRHCMLFKIGQRNVESMFRPETVKNISIGKHQVTTTNAITVLCFFLIIIAFSALGTFFLALDGVDLDTALSINACMLNNIGAAFRMANPSESFAFLSTFGKLICSLWMIMGRLEFFAVLIIFFPAFWMEKK